MIPEALSVKITRTENSQLDQVDWDNLPFGKVFSDHMLVMDYKDGQWQEAEITAFPIVELAPCYFCYPLWSVDF
jgi:branched-chain amino acid aminotransferase